jgi:hypothetical protein
MSSEPDPGIDKQKILAAITHPEPVPFPAPLPAAPAPGRPSSSATRRAITVPTTAWSTHRAELCAIVATFVSLIWISAGVAGGAGGPILIGILFGVGALAIWLLEVWSGD